MSVVGKAVGDTTAARAFQPVSQTNPTTGAPAGSAATADGSTPVTGANGTSVASNANPLPTSQVVGGSAVSASNPEPIKQYGFPTIAATQVDVTTGQVTVIGVRAARSYVMIQNLGTVPVYLGSGSPATSSTNGFMLPGVVGATVTLNTGSAVIATAASTQRVAVIEVY